MQLPPDLQSRIHAALSKYLWTHRQKKKYSKMLSYDNRLTCENDEFQLESNPECCPSCKCLWETIQWRRVYGRSKGQTRRKLLTIGKELLQYKPEDLSSAGQVLRQLTLIHIEERRLYQEVMLVHRDGHEYIDDYDDYGYEQYRRTCPSHDMCPSCRVWRKLRQKKGRLRAKCLRLAKQLQDDNSKT